MNTSATLDPGEGRQKAADELRDRLHRCLEPLTEAERKEAAPIIEELFKSSAVDDGVKAVSRVWAQPPEPEALKSCLGDLPQTKFFDSPDFYYPTERIMPRHADLVSRTFPSLWDLNGSERRKQRALDICVVTYDIAGPARGGDLETECRSLAELLRGAGHKITILYMRGPHCENGPIQKWIAHYRDLGIAFVPLPAPDLPSAPGILPSAVARPRAAYEWLRGKSFDLIYATEAKGSLYPAITAKRLGLAFTDTLFIVRAWPATLWNLIVDGRAKASLRTLAVTYMERKCIEHADIVVSPSRYLLRWMMRHGYDLPKERCFVQPSVFPADDSKSSNSSCRVTNVSELVFVGPFDSRKDMGVFSRTLETINGELRGVKVTFMGSQTADFSIRETLLERRSHLSFEIDVVDNDSPDYALAYLSGEGRMAVLPLLMDGSPSLLFECLKRGIPVLISNNGGGHEMIHNEDRPAVVCEYTPTELARRIQSILHDGAVVARLSFDPQRNLEAWKEAQLAFAEPEARRRYGGQNAHLTWNGVQPIVRAAGDRPLVSVCIAHFNRPAQLAQAIESVRQQTYQNIEIVVVDDGSAVPEAKAYLDQLETELTSGSCAGHIVRQPNRYLGAARNTAVRNSTGEFILFMDDDNLAKPREIETFLRAADHSGSDILCCYSDTFTGPDRPWEGNRYHERVTPIGDAVAFGLFRNCFGDSNCFVRRRVFEGLGGFTEDFGVGLDDHEFFLRATMRGYKLMVVPESLYWYRLSEVRLRDMHFEPFSGKTRVLNALMDNAPLCLYEILRFAQGEEHLSSTVAAHRTRTPRAIADAFFIWASGQFDTDYYLKANPDVAKSRANPLFHFVRYGVHEGRKPNLQFDPNNYIDDFPGVAASGVNPLVHSIRRGGSRQYRLPGSAFFGVKKKTT